MSRLSRTLFALCVAAAPCATARAPRTPPAPAAKGAAEERRRLPTLKPSNIFEEVKRRRATRPALSASGLARYGNELLARRGFDYDFNACDFFPPGTLTPGARPRPDGTWKQIILERRMTRAGGGEMTFRFVTSDSDSMCSECYLTLPALRVTEGGMTVVAGGAAYTLKRPASFALDEANLVADDLKTVLRTWHLPFQTIPAGVSPDGRSLYVHFNEDGAPDELVLEINADGRPRFRAAAEVGARGGEDITDYPKDPLNAYLGFMRFRAGGRAHVVRFSGPCT